MSALLALRLTGSVPLTMSLLAQSSFSQSAGHFLTPDYNIYDFNPENTAPSPLL